MKIEKILISKLIPDPANVRKHNQKNMEAIKGSLAKFGQQKPIVINAENIVIAGNGTLAAAIELGWQDIRVVRTELKGSELAAFGIADNRTAELAEWDIEGLQKMLAGFQIENIDLNFLRFENAVSDEAGFPENNTEIDEEKMAETNTECPKCGFKWMK